MPSLSAFTTTLNTGSEPTDNSDYEHEITDQIGPKNPKDKTQSQNQTHPNIDMEVLEGLGIHSIHELAEMDEPREDWDHEEVWTWQNCRAMLHNPE